MPIVESDPSQVSWHFPPVGKGAQAGIADPGIAHFEGDVPLNLVRETIQNSLDAVDGSAQKGLVTVSFRLIRVPLAEIPGNEALLQAIEASIAYLAQQSGPSGRSLHADPDSFSKPVAYLRARGFCEFLEIADTGTTGLVGANPPKAPPNQFYKLLFESGTSTVSGNAGGTWGLGKHAPLAASRLRTVFYSSRCIDEAGIGRDMFMGKTVLTRHMFKGGGQGKERDILVRQGRFNMSRS